MPLSTTEIGKLLTEFFLSPVQEQLNRETIALDLFEKARVNWAGRIAIIPVHIGRLRVVVVSYTAMPAPSPHPPLRTSTSWPSRPDASWLASRSTGWS